MHRNDSDRDCAIEEMGYGDVLTASVYLISNCPKSVPLKKYMLIGDMILKDEDRRDPSGQS